MKRKKPARKRSSRWLRKVLVPFFVVFAGIALFFGALAYWVTHPGAAPEDVAPSNFLLAFEEFVWETEQGTLLEAWFIPGRKGSPGIVLAPGYELGRADALSLSARLKDRGFHTLAFRRSDKGVLLRRGSSLGLEEADDIVSALDLMLARPGVDRTQAGIWGVDVTARGALAAAGMRPEIKAVVADSAFETVDDFLRLRLRQGLFGDNSFVEYGCRRMLALGLRTPVNEFFAKLPLEGLGKCRVLFIQGENRDEIGRLSIPVHERLQTEKEMALLPLARVRMMKAEEMEAYDKRVVSFFRNRLPVPEDPEEAAKKSRPGKQTAKAGGGKE